jgi:hypothetical protein
MKTEQRAATETNQRKQALALISYGTCMRLCNGRRPMHASAVASLSSTGGEVGTFLTHYAAHPMRVKLQANSFHSPPTSPWRSGCLFLDPAGGHCPALPPPLLHLRHCLEEVGGGPRQRTHRHERGQPIVQLPNRHPPRLWVMGLELAPSMAYHGAPTATDARAASDLLLLLLLQVWERVEGPDGRVKAAARRHQVRPAWARGLATERGRPSAT